MEEKKLVPKLRFPGFTEPWEQRKFGELFLERREKTTEENEDILLSCAITGIYLNSDLFSHFRGSSTVGYLKVRKNDLILSAQNLHLGNANINFNFEHGMISPAYKVFEIESCDPYFVNAWVKKESTKIFFLKATTEGASQCRKNIDWDALINQELLTPNALEQETIGKFFNQLDRYITLHQRKLGEMASFSKGNGYFKSDLKSTGIPIILYGRLYTKYETVIKDIDTFADAKEGAVDSLGGEVIVPASGETAEEISIASVVQNPGVLLGGDLNIIRPTENLLPSFLALSISNGSAHRAMSKRAQGKSVVHLHNEDLAQIDLKYPSVEEQSKITACINWVDNLITLHQEESFLHKYML